MQIDVAELLDITPPEFHRTRIDVRTAEDFDKGIMREVEGIKRCTRDLSLQFKNMERYDEFAEGFFNSEKTPFTISFPDGSDWLFDGFVSAVRTQAPVDGLASFSVEIKPSGPFQVKERKTMYPKGARNMPGKPAADLKPFYIGSNAMPENWTHADLKTAIAHATELVNDREGSQEEVFIVKIVKVVKRKEAPVTVSNFKAPRKVKARG